MISTEIGAIEITLGGSDLRIVKSHLDQFAKFGLEFEDEEEICDRDKSSESVKLKVIKVPTCFVMREDNDLLNYRPSPLLKLCRWLIEDIVAALRQAYLFILPFLRYAKHVLSMRDVETTHSHKIGMLNFQKYF